MSFNDILRIAGPPKYDPARNTNDLMKLAHIFKERAGDKMTTDESVHFAAQILSAFDYKYRKRREPLGTAARPIQISSRRSTT